MSVENKTSVIVPVFRRMFDLVKKSEVKHKLGVFKDCFSGREAVLASGDVSLCSDMIQVRTVASLLFFSFSVSFPLSISLFFSSKDKLLLCAAQSHSSFLGRKEFRRLGICILRCNYGRSKVSSSRLDIMVNCLFVSQFIVFSIGALNRNVLGPEIMELTANGKPDGLIEVCQQMIQDIEVKDRVVGFKVCDVL